MTPERWQAIDKLYHAALGLSGNERAALMSQADSEVRSAVEAMLAQNSQSTAILDRPAWEGDNPSTEVPPSEVHSPQVAPALAPGVLLGPYRIESAIGAGGMGQVYRAMDTRLNRHVAIKTSTARFSDRFAREARTVAALSHPNICQIYDVGPHYIVMELVDGEPLPKGPLPAATAVRLAIQIASALEAAHAKGIVHRDLKPANILVSPDSVVKLLDFGLAKHISNERPDDATQTLGITRSGMVLGTPAYMSPEQAAGKAVDARTDMFSFGAVLYELLAGKRAFPGDSSAAVMGAVMHKEPEPLDAPPALAAIVRKCLAKSPEARFQNAAELRPVLEVASTKGASPFTLRRVAAAGLITATGPALFFYLRNPPAEKQIDSIAVIPFDLESADPEAAYISDGVTESLNNSLARLPGLKVVPQSVARRFSGKSGDLQKVRAALAVEAVLTGRVVERGDGLTVAVELDDAGKGKQLWGDRYQSKVTDLLAIQRDIVRKVSQQLRPKLFAAGRQQPAKSSPNDSEAYELFLKGRYYTNKYTQDGFLKGIEYFHQALAKDPNYGPAYSGLAYNYINQDDWFMAPKQAAPKARDAATRALALDENDVGAHIVLGIEEQWYEWDWPAAERQFKRALELNPNSAHGYYSWFLAATGRIGEAVAEAERHRQTDPLGSNQNFTIGSIFLFGRQWNQAIAQLRGAIDLNPYYWFDHCFLGRAYEHEGRLTEAIAEFQRGLELDREQDELWSGLGHAYALAGKKAEAQKVMDRLKTKSKDRYVAPYNIAIIYAGMGDRDQTFAWLNRAYDERSELLVQYLTTDSRLDHLHSDPRFADLRRRTGLPE